MEEGLQVYGQVHAVKRMGSIYIYIHTNTYRAIKYRDSIIADCSKALREECQTALKPATSTPPEQSWFRVPSYLKTQQRCIHVPGRFSLEGTFSLILFSFFRPYRGISYKYMYFKRYENGGAQSSFTMFRYQTVCMLIKYQHSPYLRSREKR